VTDKFSVAVLMATFNGSLFLREQIDSILSQEGISVDIYFSDDCSTDNTLELLKNYCSKNSNCFLLSHDKKFGSSSANFFNLVIEAPLEKYDYICFSDQDDIWFKEKITNGIKKMQDGKFKGYSSNTFFWEKDKMKKLKIKKNQRQTRYDFMFQSGGTMSTYILEQKVAKKLSSFLKLIPLNKRNEIWLHDWFIYAYARKNKIPWTFDNYSGILYRQHGNNLIGGNIGLFALLKRLKLLRKWRNQVLLFSDLLDYKNDLPILRLEKLGIYLIKKPFNVRRKISESFLLFLASLIKLF
tara:strand:+ start:257 stop:1147 length:891 start_codon:yes stop_codon:yes gene_type:complete